MFTNFSFQAIIIGIIIMVEYLVLMQIYIQVPKYLGIGLFIIAGAIDILCFIYYIHRANKKYDKEHTTKNV